MKNSSEQIKQRLMGQRKGIKFALDELEMIKRSLENTIDFLDQEIEKIKE